MTATTMEVLGETRVLRGQASVTHRVVRMNVEGMTHEQSLIQPQGGGNCLNWVVGHLVDIADMILPTLGQKPVLGAETLQRYGRGTAPIQNADEALDFGKLMAAWDETAKRMDAGLAALTPEILDRPAPFSPTKNQDETVRSLLTLLAFHQAYHAGQTGLLRRIAGLEGALP